jgi:hypothetical protein
MALQNLRLRRDREGNNMAINSKFDKLITSLRTAADKEGTTRRSNISMTF